MKIICILLLINFSVYAGTCNLITGWFKTTTSECRYSHDGIIFFNEGFKDISINNEQGNSLSVNMNVSTAPYSLWYVIDGIEHLGRAFYEGDQYTAQCENNHLKVYAKFNLLKHPMITQFSVTSDGKMVYKQSFENDSFVRVCEMERI